MPRYIKVNYCLYRKKHKQLTNEEYLNLKESIKKRIILISRVEVLPKEIKALNFSLFSPYGVELIGAKVYDPKTMMGM
ncbi:hypothetical protein [Metabacillus dongyingensis]|uniref:hypothetical protein n=1 Tax=Metabacillus dongyingensis TaxID=2874282 RepID=UPI001CBE6B57|nr:hypothetical protein [Metabacillus dongyingensis]UAL52293.1 hypothetical protein K8L98_24635 [Metabacillus dongyingensis]